MRRLKKMKSKHIFLSSFFLTLLIIFSVSAMVETDYNCRYITTGDTSPPVSFWDEGKTEYMTINSFGLDKTYEITQIVNSFKSFFKIV